MPAQCLSNSSTPYFTSPFPGSATWYFPRLPHLYKTTKWFWFQCRMHGSFACDN